MPRKHLIPEVINHPVLAFQQTRPRSEWEPSQVCLSFQC